MATSVEVGLRDLFVFLPSLATVYSSDDALQAGAQSNAKKVSVCVSHDFHNRPRNRTAAVWGGVEAVQEPSVVEL